MAGIACVESGGQRGLVERMLDRLGHRGKAGRASIDKGYASLGVTWPAIQAERGADLRHHSIAQDLDGDGRLAVCDAADQGLKVASDALGVAPLYWGHTADGAFCCASEAKALLLATRDVRIFPPGALYDRSSMQLREWEPAAEAEGSADRFATDLRQALAAAVLRQLPTEHAGAWLTGRFACTAVAAVAGRLLNRLHTFAVGPAGAPHLERAHAAAIYIGSVHHETVVTIKDLIDNLPRVIFHLESFDPPLVRESLLNYLLARDASNYVSFVFTGEGGDELLCSHDGFAALTTDRYRPELTSRLRALRRTVLKRIDRTSAAQGIVTRVCFLTPKALDVTSRIPARYMTDGANGAVLLRQAMDGLLPETVLGAPEGRAWDAGGLGEELSAYAGKCVTDADFAQERRLPDGTELTSKEELLYYRIFREHFGEFGDLSWTGRL